ncbi:nucleotide-binding alpha-beta plait domain-containing protein [Tanacetum coccineum]
MGSHKSKEDDVSKISTSIFITNFPVTFSAKDLFNACKQYGHVIDAYIPIKRSKAGKRRSTHVYQKDMGQSGVGNSYVQVVKGNNTSVVAESDHTLTLALDDECLNTSISLNHVGWEGKTVIGEVPGKRVFEERSQITTNQGVVTWTKGESFQGSIQHTELLNSVYG